MQGQRHFWKEQKNLLYTKRVYIPVKCTQTLNSNPLLPGHFNLLQSSQHSAKKVGSVLNKWLSATTIHNMKSDIILGWKNARPWSPTFGFYESAFYKGPGCNRHQQNDRSILRLRDPNLNLHLPRWHPGRGDNPNYNYIIWIFDPNKLRRFESERILA